MTTVMIFEEKHGERYFAANTREDRNKIALKMLKERNDLGYMYPTVEQLENEKNSRIQSVTDGNEDLISLTEEEVNNIPAESIRQATKQRRTNIQRSLDNIQREFDLDIEWAKSLEKLLNAPEEEALKMVYTTPKGRKLPLAYRLLEDRSYNYSYEEFREETAEDY